MRRSILVIILLALSCSAARAETVAATLKKWGLTGEWSTNCDAAPGDGFAAKFRYVANRDGRVVHLRNFGETTTRDKILAAKVTPEGWLQLRVFFHGVAEGEEDRTFALRKISPGVIRAMYNYNAKGVHSIEDGKFTSNGKDSPLQHRCD